MKKTTLLGISLVLVIATIGLLIFLYPTIKEAYIRSEIEDANYCSLDSDCVDAGSKCPFGCYAYVNAAEVDRISSLINSFDSRCVYGCVSCPSATCEDGTCKEVCT